MKMKMNKHPNKTLTDIDSKANMSFRIKCKFLPVSHITYNSYTQDEMIISLVLYLFFMVSVRK